MNTIIVIGIFAFLYFAVIRPLQIRARRKGYKPEKWKPESDTRDWTTNPADPRYQATYNREFTKDW